MRIFTYQGVTDREDWYRRLFLHVILRATEEARGVNLICDRKTDPKQVKKDARIWLTTDTLDLRLVCELAEVDVEKLLWRFRKLYGMR